MQKLELGTGTRTDLENAISRFAASLREISKIADLDELMVSVSIDSKGGRAVVVKATKTAATELTLDGANILYAPDQKKA